MPPGPQQGCSRALVRKSAFQRTKKFRCLLTPIPLCEVKRSLLFLCPPKRCTASDVALLLLFVPRGPSGQFIRHFFGDADFSSAAFSLPFSLGLPPICPFPCRSPPSFSPSRFLQSIGMCHSPLRRFLTRSVTLSATNDPKEASPSDLSLGHRAFLCFF